MDDDEGTISSAGSTRTITTISNASSSSGGSLQRPRSFDSSMTYESWKKQIQLWQICCRLEKKQQAPALVLSLEGKSKEACLELDISELNSDDGVQKVLTKLDGLYKKDENQLIYVSLKKFEKHLRQTNQTLDDYINEFERLHNKLKHYGIEYPDTAVAYRLLEGANLPKDTNKLVRTTVSSFDFKCVKTQLRKLEDSAASCDKIDVAIKDEPDDTFYGHDTFYNQDTRGRSRERGSTWGGRGGIRAPWCRRRPS